jgi:RNA polymerase sigma factor (sigma-70 family)
VDVVAIDAALSRLEKFDAPQSRIVELRYFGGLTVEETAVHLGVSPETVNREWRRAKAFLHKELAAAEGTP